jgi:hypothetical protein
MNTIKPCKVVIPPAPRKNMHTVITVSDKDGNHSKELPINAFRLSENDTPLTIKELKVLELGEPLYLTDRYINILFDRHKSEQAAVRALGLKDGTDLYGPFKYESDRLAERKQIGEPRRRMTDLPITSWGSGIEDKPLTQLNLEAFSTRSLLEGLHAATTET